MSELQYWTCDMDVTVKARNPMDATAIMHFIAEHIEKFVQGSEVTLGDHLRVESIPEFNTNTKET